MAKKRQQQLEASLEGPTTTPSGWRDKFQATRKDTEYQRKTYLLEPEMVQRIARLAQDEDVPINDLVRFLLTHALDEVESGRVELPVRVVTVAKRRIE